MDATNYQELAGRTLIAAPDFKLTDQETMIAWNALGLAGEAGEVVDSIKKGIFHRHGIDSTKIRKELGDVMWYVAALCTKFGFDLSDIMDENIEKLKIRYPEGYSDADSVLRVDTR